MQKNLLNLIVCITFSLLAAPDVISQCSIDDENCESSSAAQQDNSGDESDLLIDPT